MTVETQKDIQQGINTSEGPSMNERIQELQKLKGMSDYGAFTYITPDNFPNLHSSDPKLLATYKMEAIINRMSMVNRQRHQITDNSGGLLDEIQMLQSLCLSIREEYFPEREDVTYEVPLWIPDSEKDQLRFALNNGIHILINKENFPWLAMIPEGYYVQFKVEAINIELQRWESILTQTRHLGYATGTTATEELLIPVQDKIRALSKLRTDILLSLAATADQSDPSTSNTIPDNSGSA